MDKPQEEKTMIATALKAHYVFDGLSEKLVDDIVDVMKPVAVSAGTPIITQVGPRSPSRPYLLCLRRLGDRERCSFSLIRATVCCTLVLRFCGLTGWGPSLCLATFSDPGGER